MQFQPEIDLDFDTVAIKSEKAVREELNDLAGKLADVLNNGKTIAPNDAAYLHAMLSHIVTKAEKPVVAKVRDIKTAPKKAPKPNAQLSLREAVDAGVAA